MLYLLKVSGKKFLAVLIEAHQTGLFRQTQLMVCVTCFDKHNLLTS